MLAMHAVINIGMCLTLLPVSGVPLPFISYGGSNLMTNLMAIGLVLISAATASSTAGAPDPGSGADGGVGAVVEGHLS